jgi:hypothetical protein
MRMVRPSLISKVNSAFQMRMVRPSLISKVNSAFQMRMVCPSLISKVNSAFQRGVHSPLTLDDKCLHWLRIANSVIRGQDVGGMGSTPCKALCCMVRLTRGAVSLSRLSFARWFSLGRGGALRGPAKRGYSASAAALIYY